MNDQDLAALRTAGWDEDAVYEATALISFFNCSGRMEAASGLPMDEVPAEAKFAEATPDNPLKLTLTPLPTAQNSQGG